VANGAKKSADRINKNWPPPTTPLETMPEIVREDVQNEQETNKVRRRKGGKKSKGMGRGTIDKKDSAPSDTSGGGYGWKEIIVPREC